MLVVHAIWSEGALHLWAESAARWPTRASSSRDPSAGATSADPRHAAPHPFAATADEIAQTLSTLGATTPDRPSPAALRLRLPVVGDAPQPSPRLAHEVGAPAQRNGPPSTALFEADALRIEPRSAPTVLERLEDEAETGRVLRLGDSVGYFAALSRFVRHLLAAHRVVPSLAQRAGNGSAQGAVALQGLWQPWLADEPTRERLDLLVGAIPPSARAAADAYDHRPLPIVEDALLTLTDARCREALVAEGFDDAIDGRDPSTDIHVAWLTGLLRRDPAVEATPSQRDDLLRKVPRWIGRLEERGTVSDWRLSLRLNEPIETPDLADGAAPGDSVRWTLSFHLQSVQHPGVIVDAEEIWLLPAGAVSVDGCRLETPRDVLLAELGRASRIYQNLEKALEQPEPSSLELTTAEAYTFLRQMRPVLLEQGFGVEAPQWWDSPGVRLGARLRVTSDPIEDLFSDGADGDSPTAPVVRVGLKTLVDSQWELVLGDQALTLEQFERLAAQNAPLVRLGGRWVEIRPEDARSALEFLHENPGGTIEAMEALRLAYGTDARRTGLPVLGLEATGWFASVFTDPTGDARMPMLSEPDGFIGTLRPYQRRGLSWLAFLDAVGLGACLADDMGLGKTIQLLALLAHERAVLRHDSGGNGEQPVPEPRPTLLIAPMSVARNWLSEARRFTPGLRVLLHHGPEREHGQRLRAEAEQSDLVITTYALAARDHEHLDAVRWRRIVLDEAQNIKNPQTKQAKSIRSLEAPRRVALTGTPIENRLTELWSVMDFLNPGYLGTTGDFRRRFAIPVERYHDQGAAARLRGLIQPFVLRRHKSDPTVITDLPEKVESREYCYLTPEQASLYQSCVREMLSAADRAEGIQRRGLVLAGLIRLKQICNHPAHFLREFSPGQAPPNAARSGKAARLEELLEEVLAEGQQALVFTQFRRMGDILAAMLRHDLDREVLFLHGGTPAAQRETMIETFQRSDGRHPIFILSLRAGGFGLNLTAATHVFHFDRWWNPAVEAQATDRAYRIGQSKTVHVHSFVVGGTLEERIDQMIEQKTELAEKIIGSGERWLTELSTSQLRDLLTLRHDAVEDDR